MKTIFGGIGILTLAIIMGLCLGFGIQAYAMEGYDPETCPDGPYMSPPYSMYCDYVNYFPGDTVPEDMGGGLCYDFGAAGDGTDGQGNPAGNYDCTPPPPGDPGDPPDIDIEALCPCNDDWKNHGKYVRCVAYESEEFVFQGIITEDEGDELVSGAAQSQCGK